MPQPAVKKISPAQETRTKPSSTAWTVDAPPAKPAATRPKTRGKAPSAAAEAKEAKAAPARKPPVPKAPSKASGEKPKPEDAYKAVEQATESQPEESEDNQPPKYVGQPADKDLIETIERDVLDRAPNVKWEDIAGLENAKKILEEAAVYPFLMPEYFQGLREPWKGVLLFGPPGTGKTLLAKAVATQCQTTFFNVTSTTLTSKYRGDSERLVRILFDMARFYAPSVDSLAGNRDDDSHEASRRVKSELLVQMDGVGSSTERTEDGVMKTVLVLGATNYPWNLDQAVLRRLEKRVHIPLPTKPSILQMLELNLRTVKLAEDVDLEKLSDMLEGYNGGDIKNICRDASFMAMRRRTAGMGLDQLREIGKELAKLPVTQEDFLTSVGKTHSSVRPEDVAKHLEWEEKSGAS